MNANVTHPQPNLARKGTGEKRYSGEVAYIYAFDVAYDTVRKPIREVLGCPVAQYAVDTGKRTPRHLLLHRPQMARLQSLERIGPLGPVRLERYIKIFPVGSVSITIRVPFEVDHVEELVAFHDLQFNNGDLHTEVKQLAEQVRVDLKDCFIRPMAQLTEEEAYTVFCLKAPLQNGDGEKISAEDWFIAHRRQVAALLTQEPNIDDLSSQEAEESTGRYLSYYQNDLVVIDWDAALIVDEPQDFDETLYIMELANFQLAELEAYDRILDDALERSYRDLSVRPGRSRVGVMRDLREIRVDLARISDEISNITKFFGDWHLARIYQAMSARFHLADWHKTIDEKLKTLDDLYQILNQDQNNRWMLILELTIVLLFIIDLVILAMGLK